MIIIVVVIYAVCWLPLHVITLIGDVNPDIYSFPHMNVVWLCAHWLAMSHSCYNPIVYFSHNSPFRRNLKRMLTVCRHKRRRLRRHLSVRHGFWNGEVDIYGSAESVRSKYSIRSMQSTKRIARQPESSEDWDSLRKVTKRGGVTNDMYL
ncbi:hypothetical protein BsWGS_06152 [Bradybaena similaris]